MYSNRQLTEIALSGRWVSAASIWIDQNAPCTAGHAIEQITKIMPFTIRGSGSKVMSRSHLAKKAIKEYCKTIELPADYLIQPRPTRGKGLEPAILLEIKKNGPAMVRDFAVSRAKCRLGNLVRRNALRFLQGVYYAEGQDPLQYKPRQKKVVIENSQLNENKRKP